MHIFHSVLMNQAAILNRIPGTQRELSDLKSDFGMCFDVLVGPGTRKLEKLSWKASLYLQKKNNRKCATIIPDRVPQEIALLRLKRFLCNEII